MCLAESAWKTTTPDVVFIVISYIFLYVIPIWETSQFWYCERRLSIVFYFGFIRVDGVRHLFFFLISLFSNSKYGIRISSCPKCGLPLFITNYYYMIINIVFDFLFNLEGVIFIISQMTFVWRGVAGRSPAVRTTLSFVFLLVLMIFKQRLPRRWRYLF